MSWGHPDRSLTTEPICSSRTVVFNTFQAGKPLYTLPVEVRSHAVYLNLLTACFPQLLLPRTGTARSTGTDNHFSRPSLQYLFLVRSHAATQCLMILLNPGTSELHLFTEQGKSRFTYCVSTILCSHFFLEVYNNVYPLQAGNSKFCNQTVKVQLWVQLRWNIALLKLVGVLLLTKVSPLCFGWIVIMFKQRSHYLIKMTFIMQYYCNSQTFRTCLL